jgi:hypothetical protein
VTACSTTEDFSRGRRASARSLAATFDLDAADVIVFLEAQVRALGAELASERVEFEATRRRRREWLRR